MTQKIVGYLLILVGVAMEVITVLVWAGMLQPPVRGFAVEAASFWQILLALVQSAPWPAVVGLLMIYAGLKMLQVQLPF